MKTAIVFPGQGSQTVGMGEDLMHSDSSAMRIFEQANEILDFDLASLCFKGPAERLEVTDIQQPAILVTSLAYWAALSEKDQKLSYEITAGLSLGEYTALHIAGALSFKDAVRLVRHRGRFMQEAAEKTPSGMVSILGMDPDSVNSLCKEASDGEILTPANFNCPGQIVISGTKAACERAASLVETRGTGKAIVLKVAGAFHSQIMKPAADRLLAELEKTEFQMPRVPVISNVTARPHASADDIRRSLYEQVFSPVRWQASVQWMIENGIERFVEVGPGRALTGMLRKIDRTRTGVNVSSKSLVEEFWQH